MSFNHIVIKIEKYSEICAQCIELCPRLSGAAINRSPKSYSENPKEERDSYGTSTDETVHQLHVVSHPGNEIMGLINWFAVHAPSMNSTNKLISGDSKESIQWCSQNHLGTRISEPAYHTV